MIYVILLKEIANGPRKILGALVGSLDREKYDPEADIWDPCEVWVLECPNSKLKAMEILHGLCG